MRNLVFKFLLFALIQESASIEQAEERRIDGVSTLLAFISLDIISEVSVEKRLWNLFYCSI